MVEIMLRTEPQPLETTPDGEKFYSQTQLSWLGKARRFADKIPTEDVIKSDRENTFQRDLFEAACREGFGALPFSKTYGGTGGDYVSFALVNEEFGRRCVPIMSSLGVHVLCQEPIYRYGTDEQKEKYLRPSATGEYLAAFGLTEPGAGSDTAALATTAKQDGDTYMLNGTKTFITSGGAADYYIIMAKLNDAAGSLNAPAKSEGTITSFIVERNFPGFAIGQKFDMLGMRGYATCELVFSNCRVPAMNLLGQHGEGRKVALGSLAKGRVTIAAQATGWAQGALDAGIKWLNGKSKADVDACAAQLGELAVLVESARVLVYQAAASIDRGESDVTLAAMAKTQATDAAMKVATDVMTLLGPDGARPELLLERIFRDAKAGQIYEGTNQIQRMLIARTLMK
jgi:acyl-CoA dehydrogenase